MEEAQRRHQQEFGLSWCRSPGKALTRAGTAAEPGEAGVGGKKGNRGLSKASQRGRGHSRFLTSGLGTARQTAAVAEGGVGSAPGRWEGSV